ncbi:MAG: ribosome maturation factor RimM [Lachnospiraceae bacterium]|nr:ribosome maturation factor RimM [Lachnospiraceae bacterium]
MEDLLRVGVISSTHGVRGEVKVYPTTDDPTRFEALSEVLVDTKKSGIVTLGIERVAYFKNMVILKFKGIDCMEEAEKYKGQDLLVTRENAVPLEEGEFFICDIIGSIVFEENGEEFGVLKDVLQTGANDVFVVDAKNGKEVLLPVIDDCVKEIDVEGKRIVAYIMPGLM